MSTIKPQDPHVPISRREFLHLSGLGLAGLFLQPVVPLSHPPTRQGRILEDKTPAYEGPSEEGRLIKYFWKDTVVNISRATVGEDSAAYNRIWYQLTEDMFIHSSGIQPVKTHLNQPAEISTPEGQLAEVTVPFTDAHWGPDRETPVAYRFYYATTYWVLGVVKDTRDQVWYRVLCDKWGFHFYAPAQHLRLVHNSELATISPNVPLFAKRLEVQTGPQMLVAYEGEIPVFKARISSGAVFRTGNFSTPLGRFSTFHKRPTRHMAAGDLASNGYDLPGVPWVTYFTEEGIAFHGTYWHNDYGAPRSHGCINLTPQAARWVYLWTLPSVPPDKDRVYETYGTTVDVV